MEKTWCIRFHVFHNNVHHMLCDSIIHSTAFFFFRFVYMFHSTPDIDAVEGKKTSSNRFYFIFYCDFCRDFTCNYNAKDFDIVFNADERLIYFLFLLLHTKTDLPLANKHRNITDIHQGEKKQW